MLVTRGHPEAWRTCSRSPRPLPSLRCVQIWPWLGGTTPFEREQDILFFQPLSFIVGGTEAEVRRKEREIDDHASLAGYASHIGGSMGVDLGEIPLDVPIGELGDYNIQGVVKAFVEAAPDQTITFGDLVRFTADTRVAGTPEQIADELERWIAHGVDGINVMYYTTPGSFEDFIDGVVPVLRARGLVRDGYREGTLREKLSDGRSGPRPDQRHPASAVRRARLAVAAA